MKAKATKSKILVVINKWKEIGQSTGVNTLHEAIKAYDIGYILYTLDDSCFYVKGVAATGFEPASP